MNKFSGDHSINDYKKAKKVAALLCEREGFEFVHLEYKNETKRKLLRLYIDKPEGITIGDCANFSRTLSDMLDVEWNNNRSYNLEVSSPGIERPLGKLEDFNRFSGKKIKVKLVNTINGRKEFCGKILDVCEDIVRLSLKSEIINLKYINIAQASLVVLDGDS